VLACSPHGEFHRCRGDQINAIADHGHARLIKTRILPDETQASLDALKYEWSRVEDAASAVLHMAAEESVNGMSPVLLEFSQPTTSSFRVKIDC
jgi:hypothetical protein